jgi:hypothetical protein
VQSSGTRIPIDDVLALHVGRAVIAFAYYQHTTVWIIGSLDEKYIGQYSRGKPVTAGQVAKKLRALGENPALYSMAVTQSEFRALAAEFDVLAEERNTLLHAHPITDVGSIQSLNYQGSVEKRISDKKWNREEVAKIVSAFDDAACRANDLLHRIRRIYCR